MIIDIITSVMEKRDFLTGKCIDISFEGKGVVKTEQGIVFVDGVFPDEELEVFVEYTRAGQKFGKIRRLITKSPDRIQPLCGICTACGGCQFQQLSYQAQLEYKTKKVASAFERNFHHKFNVLPCLGMENPYNYRNKIQVPLGKDLHGNIISGFYRSNTHKIIATDVCYIDDERSRPIIKDIKLLMRSFKIEPYDEDRRTGCIRHVLIRTAKHKEQLMLTLVTALDEFKGKKNFVKAIVEKHPEITTVVQNINTRDTNVILGDKERILYGKGFIEDSILGVNFRISSKSFYQVNPIQVDVLYGKAMEFAGLTGNETVLDAYCGIGTISLIAAKHAKEVYGVEIVKEAIKDAIGNAKLNNITNAKFECDDASKYMLRFNQTGIKPDVVFVDPPRKGLDETFINSLLVLAPKKVVYVSCNCETLARDLTLLSCKYDIKKIQPVDMFPMTHHVETVCALSLKK